VTSDKVDLLPLAVVVATEVLETVSCILNVVGRDWHSYGIKAM
jgi:hypothetical protein